MKIFLVAGEISGDLLGAELISSMRRENATVEFYGCGGARMAAAGQQQLFDLTRYAVVGLWDVLKNYGKFLHLFSRLLHECKRLRPAVVVLIDFPGFNIRFARAVRSALPQAKIVYYVSPQLWAWRPSRVQHLRRCVDEVISILPFEQQWYRKHAPELKVHWVGHPILDRVRPALPDRQLPQCTTVALLPGSRKKELLRHCPILFRTMPLLEQQLGEVRFIILAPNEEIAEWIEKQLQKFSSTFPSAARVEVCCGYAVTHLSQCHLAIVASGTATIECALAGTPMVVFYVVNPITYVVGRLLVKVPYLCMINLLCNRGVVPELIQDNATPERLSAVATDILCNEQLQNTQRLELCRAVQMLGQPGASRRAAQLILQQAACQ